MSSNSLMLLFVFAMVGLLGCSLAGAKLRVGLNTPADGAPRPTVEG